jgi:hypothetical protein
MLTGHPAVTPSAPSNISRTDVRMRRCSNIVGDNRAEGSMYQRMSASFRAGLLTTKAVTCSSFLITRFSTVVRYTRIGLAEVPTIG